MEFHIKNNYIKKFLSKHPTQNELKLIKYLTVLGIHQLEKEGKSNVSFNEIKKKARKRNRY